MSHLVITKQLMPTLDIAIYSMFSFWHHKKPSNCPPSITKLEYLCFINSPLQALAWTPWFTGALEAKCTTKVAKTSTSSAKVKLLKTLHSVLDSCHVVPDGLSIFGAVSSASFVKRVSELVPDHLTVLNINKMPLNFCSGC